MFVKMAQRHTFTWNATLSKLTEFGPICRNRGWFRLNAFCGRWSCNLILSGFSLHERVDDALCCFPTRTKKIRAQRVFVWECCQRMCWDGGYEFGGANLCPVIEVSVLSLMRSFLMGSVLIDVVLRVWECSFCSEGAPERLKPSLLERLDHLL